MCVGLQICNALYILFQAQKNLKFPIAFCVASVVGFRRPDTLIGEVQMLYVSSSVISKTKSKTNQGVVKHSKILKRKAKQGKSKQNITKQKKAEHNKA